MKHVCVVIVGYRNGGDILDCLDALSQQTHANFEIVVCENGGSDAARKLAASLPAKLAGGQPVDLIEARDNPGYAGGINRVLTYRPHADAWWILNPDTLPDPGALAALAAKLELDNVDAVGSVQLDGDGMVQNTGAHFNAWLARTEAIGKSKEKRAQTGAIDNARMNVIMGASMLVSRRWVAVAGLLREDYFLYCEEVEWCLRAQRLGLRIALAPTAYVVHHQGSTTGSAGSIGSRQRLPIYLDERNKLNTVRDTAPLMLVSAIPASLLLALLRYGRRRAWRQLGYALSGWVAGVANRRGKPRWFIS